MLQFLLAQEARGNPFQGSRAQQELKMHAPPCPWKVFTSSILSVLVMVCSGVSGASFNFVNECEYTVWPGVLSSAGWPLLANGGFVLESGKTTSVSSPSGWSGRFWARTGCSFSPTSGGGTCASGDCGGKLQCSGAGASPPATLVEITLAGSATAKDFYDVSLVDGYNLPMIISPNGGSGNCSTAGCIGDLNHKCPTELQVVDDNEVVACKSACDAFQSPQYCCEGAYGNPSTCKPSSYSEVFKTACPNAYSYAYDDASSIFTCSGADYTVTFCPSSSSAPPTGHRPRPFQLLSATLLYYLAMHCGRHRQ